MMEPARSAISDPKLAAWELQLNQAKQAFKERFEQAVWGPELFAPYVACVDQILSDLFRVHFVADSDLLLVAVGGYGRAELCPYSDLDFWILTSGRRNTTKSIAAPLEKLLYQLWDLKLSVGHAARSWDELFNLAEEDLTAATALLDLRLIVGDAESFERLQQRTKKFFAHRQVSFAHQLRAEQNERRPRFGDTVFLLEPNVKNGEGGYRDVLLGFWAAQARSGARHVQDLIAARAIGERNARTLVHALHFFQLLRVGMQFYAGRKSDRLTFEMQEALAGKFYRSGRPVWAVGEAGSSLVEPAPSAKPAVAPAVEALMQHYFVCAKQVRREVESLLHRAERPKRKGVLTRRLDDIFGAEEDRLVIADEPKLRRHPEAMVSLFALARKAGLQVAPETLDWISEWVAHQAKDNQLVNNETAQNELVKLLMAEEKGGSTSLLEELHDVGLLGLLMPEFAPCTARVQHDLYHVYTVDQHLLYALSRLKAVARGEFKAEWPLATKVIAETGGLRSLYLGTLLHDVGKPLGKGHSETGARMARTIAARMGFSETEIEHTEFLVRQHLLLAHLSQRRDIDDPQVAAEVAAQVGSLDLLRQLYLLSIADMAMVAPGNLTEWKHHLIDELFAHVARCFGAEESDQRSDVELRERRVAQAGEFLPAGTVGIETWATTLPARYFRVHPARRMARHFLLSTNRRGPLAVDVLPRLRKQITELTICIDDFPGALAKITGVLLAHRMNVLHAEVVSRLTADGKTEVLDVFAVRDRYGQPITDAQKWAKFERDLATVITADQDVDVLIANNYEPNRLPERVVPKVETEVVVSNSVSPAYTVIDVFTLDRVGVLYQITRTLSELGLNIALSKIATEAARVIDVFYVRDLDGNKIVDTDIESVRDRLTAALAKVAT